MSRFFLTYERFTVSKILGGGIVLAGTVLGVLPPLIYNNSSQSLASNTPFWVSFTVSAVFPAAIYNVWLEVLFQRYEVDVLHLVTWTNFYETILCILALPLTMIPRFGQNLSLYQIFQEQIRAFECIASVKDIPGCMPGAWLPFFASVVVILLFVYLEATVIEQESATFQAIVQALLTPSTAIYFSIRFLAGSQQEPLTWYIITALVVIVIGMVVYKLQTLLPSRKKDSLQRWLA